MYNVFKVLQLFGIDFSEKRVPPLKLIHDNSHHLGQTVFNRL